MGLINDIKQSKRMGDGGSRIEEPPLIRLFGFIREVGQVDDSLVPMVRVEVENRPGFFIKAGKFIPLSYCPAEYKAIFGSTDIKGAYVEVITDELQRSATARILALESDVRRAVEAGGKGGTVLAKMGTGFRIKSVEEEGTPSTKQYLGK